jgi:RNA polymerase sigma factor (sigma-70 family)
MSDDPLVRGLLDPDPGVVDRAWKKILTSACKAAAVAAGTMGLSKTNEDDATQEAIVRLSRLSGDRLRKIENLEAYLSRIVFNCAKDLLKAKSRQEPLYEDIGDAGEEDGSSPLEWLAGQDKGSGDPAPMVECLEIIEKVLCEAPKEQGEVFCLFLRGHSYAEIARMTEHPENTVSIWIHRIRLAMRKALGLPDS